MTIAHESGTSGPVRDLDAEDLLPRIRVRVEVNECDRPVGRRDCLHVWLCDRVISTETIWAAAATTCPTRRRSPVRPPPSGSEGTTGASPKSTTRSSATSRWARRAPGGANRTRPEPGARPIRREIVLYSGLRDRKPRLPRARPGPGSWAGRREGPARVVGLSGRPSSRQRCCGSNTQAILRCLYPGRVISWVRVSLLLLHRGPLLCPPWLVRSAPGPDPVLAPVCDFSRQRKSSSSPVACSSCGTALPRPSRRLPGADDADLGVGRDPRRGGEPVLVAAAPREPRRSRLPATSVLADRDRAVRLRVSRSTGAGWPSVSPAHQAQAERRFTAEAAGSRGTRFAVCVTSNWALGCAAGVASSPRGRKPLAVPDRLRAPGRRPRRRGVRDHGARARGDPPARCAQRSRSRERFALLEVLQLGRRLGPLRRRAR